MPTSGGHHGQTAKHKHFSVSVYYRSGSNQLWHRQQGLVPSVGREGLCICWPLSCWPGIGECILNPAVSKPWSLAGKCRHLTQDRKLIWLTEVHLYEITRRHFQSPSVNITCWSTLVSILAKQHADENPGLEECKICFHNYCDRWATKILTAVSIHAKHNTCGRSPTVFCSCRWQQAYKSQAKNKRSA